MSDDIGKHVLPFGKHQGKTLDEVPLDYRDWIVDEPWLRVGLRTVIKQYLSIPCVARELDELLEDRDG